MLLTESSLVGNFLNFLQRLHLHLFHTMQLQLLVLFVIISIFSSSNGFLHHRSLCRVETRLNAIRDLYPHYHRKRLELPERLRERVRLKTDVKKIGKKGDIVSVTMHQWRFIIKKKHLGYRLSPEEMEVYLGKRNATRDAQREMALEVHRNISALPRLTMYGSIDDNNTFVRPFLNRHLIDEIHDAIGIGNIKRMILPTGVQSVAEIQVNSDGTEVKTDIPFNFRRGLSITKPGVYEFSIRLQRNTDPGYVTVNLLPVPPEEQSVIV